MCRGVKRSTQKSNNRASDITLALLYIRTELSALLDIFICECIFILYHSTPPLFLLSTSNPISNNAEV